MYQYSWKISADFVPFIKTGKPTSKSMAEYMQPVHKFEETGKKKSLSHSLSYVQSYFPLDNFIGHFQKGSENTVFLNAYAENFLLGSKSERFSLQSS